VSRPVRILLAEDDRILRKAGEVSLRKKGYEVIAAVDGEDALAKTRDQKPDLILLDVMMPKMHGFDVLSALKSDSSVRDIPVIMLTNRGNSKRVEINQAIQNILAGQSYTRMRT